MTIEGPALASGTIHDLFNHIGYRTSRTADGDLVVELPVASHVVNTNGGLQGGLLATLVDIVAGQRALEVIAPGTSVVTSDLSVRYLRPIRTGVARATARIVYSGKRSLVMQVDIQGAADDELAAIATVSFATITLNRQEDGN
jgi:uncharacterized protein (TIGR00369 family)